MNEENFGLVKKYIPSTYVNQGNEAHKNAERSVRILLEQAKLPTTGWNNLSIKHLLSEIAMMDSNNFPGNCGLGEREARISSSIVAERHFYFGHGMGRSGDLREVQPKASGSSLIAKLTNQFAVDAIKIAGVGSVKACQVCPVATGMALVLCMISLKEKRENAKYVVWPRIDQKSCFKSILTAGFTPIIIENVRNGDHLETNVEAIKEAIMKHGSDSIACVLSTTSCFAPRIPDKLEEIGLICKETNVPHIVNNAYGLQSSKCMHLIQQANLTGRLDAFVQSTDKNFMVPVGGSIIAGFDKHFIESVAKVYPGRASASPIIDFFITMLSLGSEGYKKYLEDRKRMYTYLQDGLQSVANLFNERLLVAKSNQISIAISLRTLDEMFGEKQEKITKFGSFLFRRSVSGTRVVTPYAKKTIDKYEFQGWGSHHRDYQCSYLTAAAAVGVTREEIDLFLNRLEKNFKDFEKKHDCDDNV